MFIQAKLKEHILSDVTTAGLRIVDPGSRPPAIKVFDMDGDELEDFDTIRSRLFFGAGHLQQQDEGDDPDEEWCHPVRKISGLSPDDPSWLHAKEILDPPSAACHKIGDESRSLAARHVIDRLIERNLLSSLEEQSPRLRSAVELLSKPDADFVYPAVSFMTSQIRIKYPDTYNSVTARIPIKIPEDETPSTILVHIAKEILENPSTREVEANWGKFIAILATTGALAIDSVEAGYPKGVIEVVETFGGLVEQFMAEWILSAQGGGGWESFIKENSYNAILPPVPRAILILTFFAFLLHLIIPYFIAAGGAILLFIKTVFVASVRSIPLLFFSEEATSLNRSEL